MSALAIALAVLLAFLCGVALSAAVLALAAMLHQADANRPPARQADE